MSHGREFSISILDLHVPCLHLFPVDFQDQVHSIWFGNSSGRGSTVAMELEIITAPKESGARYNLK